jgi:hypothetical protein
MSNKKKNPVEDKNNVGEETPEESLQKIIDNARTKSEAYKKILKSLNINKNRD